MKFSLKALMFIIVALAIWFSLNSYFLWRFLTLPLFSGKIIKIVSISIVAFLALSYLIGRMVVHRGYGGFAVAL
ncbi:MAG: hypothetical protein N2445_00715, partial [Acidobacteria bacterium]|nr:hypothetical protein [Acidobacteriota bacterium]